MSPLGSHLPSYKACCLNAWYFKKIPLTQWPLESFSCIPGIGDLFDFQTCLFLHCYFAVLVCINHQCPSGSHRQKRNAHTHAEIFIVSLSTRKHLLELCFLTETWFRVICNCISGDGYMSPKEAWLYILGDTKP